MKLLLIEDEHTLATLLKKGLTKKGYAVDLAFDGEEGLEFFHENDYDLILLDLNLPKINGFALLEIIRQTNQDINILILSAKSETDDVVKGLLEGANDYVTKPFDFPILEARIQSLLRRSFYQKPEIASFDSLTLNVHQNEVKIKDELLSLTLKEYSILRYLTLHQNQITSAETLIEHVWDSEVDLFSNSLKFHLFSLRKKLGEFGEDTPKIETIRGSGYRLISSESIDKGE
ncbi:response regulator transcription factor [Vagococcus hydrophili]|uniref:Response regulator transcription factor n=1 Tax=Vagococcus hydrophili TaxID=2714947 RepID=A0A6G8AV44_9ENTE|nr:response regulator transcription factor [Vagococcus hydrophili]QIL48839.1 response regulator transcription factor [Vagococcus hydrophili]